MVKSDNKEPEEDQLIVSKNEAKARVQKQIDEGKEISELPVNTALEIQIAKDKLESWYDFTRETLLRTFSTKKMEQEFIWAVRIIHADALRNFRDHSHRYLNKLKSILQRIELYDDIESKKQESPDTNSYSFETMSTKLEKFISNLNEYINLIPQTFEKNARKAVASKALQLRSQLLAESGQYKDIISELTSIPKTLAVSKDVESQTDRWVFALSLQQSRASIEVLVRNVDIAQQAFGKLKDDIDKGLRNQLGQLIDTQSIAGTIDNKETLNIIENICSRFHLISRQLLYRHDSRRTLNITDEYDVQDLLYALLIEHFDDIRPEEWTPSYAGGASKMDFALKSEQVVIEVKKTRENLKDRQIGEQLLVDIARYKEYRDCKFLICFVYDPERQINNPRGLENDLAKCSSGKLEVKVFIRPR